MVERIELHLDKMAGWLAFGLVVLSLFAFAANPISMFAGVDSSVFFYIGSGMADGLLPYKDMFDHKGLLIYFINWLGASLGLGIIGVWIVESALYALSVTLLFRSVRRWASPGLALTVCIFYIWLFFRFACGGNMTESYAVYFILPVWLLFVDDVLFGVPRKRTSFAAGLAAGAILMLRPNMLSVCVPVGYHVLACSIKQKSWRLFSLHAMIVLVGVLVLIAPLLAYAVYHDILGDMYECYIRFNVLYAMGLKAELDASIVFAGAAIALNLYGLCMITGVWRIVLGYNLGFTGVTIILILMKLQYAHYYLPLVPCCVLSIVALMMNSKRARRLLYFASVIVALMWGVYSLVGANIDLHSVKWAVCQRDLTKITLTRNRVAEIEALKKSMPVDATSILVLGNACEVYRVLEKRTQCRYFYQTVARFSPEVQGAVASFVRRREDPYLVTWERDLGSFADVVCQNYQHVLDVGHWRIWKKRRDDMICPEE